MLVVYMQTFSVHIEAIYETVPAMLFVYASKFSQLKYYSVIGSVCVCARLPPPFCYASDGGLSSKILSILNIYAVRGSPAQPILIEIVYMEKYCGMAKKEVYVVVVVIAAATANARAPPKPSSWKNDTTRTPRKPFCKRANNI